MTPSKALFWFGISFLVGIAVESFIAVPQLFVWGILIFGFGCVAFSILVKKEVAVMGFCLLFLALGVLRLQMTQFTIQQDPVSKLNDSGQKVTLAGTIIDGADVRDNSQKLKVQIDHVKSIVLVTTAAYPEFHYLDHIQMTGKLATPMVAPDFNYKNYLLKDGIYSVMGFPVIKVIAGGHQYNVFSFLYEKILWVKESMAASINQTFASPHSILLQGILLGNNKTMTQSLRDQLSATGLRYLTAISGLHVIILGEIVVFILLWLGLWRQQAFCLAIVFVWLYVVMTGFPASGIRAGIMGSIFLMSQVFGRQNTSTRTIVVAAALMLLQNPLLLVYDVGFQLSFLAAMGIIHVKPLFDVLLKKVFHGQATHLSNIVTVTLAAQALTIPIMVFNFGTISLIAPLTNILIVPVMYFIMLFGFLAAVAGMAANMLGIIFSVPAWILISYFLKVMDLFYQPWAVVQWQNISWAWLAIYYVILLAIVWRLNKKLQPEFLEY